MTNDHPMSVQKMSFTAGNQTDKKKKQESRKEKSNAVSDYSL